MMDTVLAMLTPPGKAAIATLGLRGPRAWEIVRRLFQPRVGNLPDEAVPGRFWFGRLGDEIILAAKDPEHVEMHCHGGLEVVRMLQEQVAACGVHVVSWQQFLDSGPLEQMLASAPTVRTAAILLDQVGGAWERCVKDREALERLDKLIPLGRHLVEPWEIVIAGAPNVGKSSLMNALAGFTRSIVASTPGTTRDVVTLRLALDGWPIELTDTAGIRDAATPLEGQGIERARAVIGAADLRLWIADGSSAAFMPDDGRDWMIVINKIDLPAAWNWNELADASRVSARTGAGLAELCAALSRRLVPELPEPGAAVPCLPDHVEFIRNGLQRGR